MATTGISRRTALTRTAAGAGIALTGSLNGLFGTSSAAALGRGKPTTAAGYGPLIDDPAGLLALPEGFSYKLIAQTGVTTLESGQPTPSDPDGAAAFVRHGGSGSVLVMNHEVSGSEPYPVPKLAGLTYDPAVGGGCTALEVDKNGNRVSQYVTIAGTLNNCAGGRSPWNTWLTCEESEGATGQTKRHGYVFEVDPYDMDRNLDPKPIKALGRYAHESLVIDPDTGVIYLTEDAGNPNGLLFRWTPPAAALPLGRGTLRSLPDNAGTLEALKAFTLGGAYVPDLSVAVEPGTTYRAQWVNVPDRDAATVSVRKQFSAGQITRSRKLEGMWWGDGGAYFVASFARTSDGSAAQHDGQVWFLDPLAQTLELKLHFAYTPADQDNDPDGPDNITVSPYGGVILAEDGDGKNHLVGSTDSGEAFFFARNEHADDSEFAGVTFSQNKKTLFANVQFPGFTYAIQGPFTKQR
jgi:hypothetical protein